MRSVTYVYDQYKHPITITGKCPVCGKASRRSTTFTETHNPFNKNERGEVKTPDEIRHSLAQKAEQWKPDFRHWKCAGEEQ